MWSSIIRTNPYQVVEHDGKQPAHASCCPNSWAVLCGLLLVALFYVVVSTTPLIDSTSFYEQKFSNNVLHWSLFGLLSVALALCYLLFRVYGGLQKLAITGLFVLCIAVGLYAAMSLRNGVFGSAL